MKTSKLAVVGLLICLISLYLMSDAWIKIGLAFLGVFGVYGFPIGVIVTFIGIFKKQ